MSEVASGSQPSEGTVSSAVSPIEGAEGPAAYSSTRPSTVTEAAVVTTSLPVTKNVTSAALLVTEDKVKIALTDHETRLLARKGWHVPLGVFRSVIAVFPSADFKDYILKADQWAAIFLVASVVSFCWLVKAGLRGWKARRDDPVQEVLSDLRGGP